MQIFNPHILVHFKIDCLNQDAQQIKHIYNKNDLLSSKVRQFFKMKWNGLRKKHKKQYFFDQKGPGRIKRNS